MLEAVGREIPEIFKFCHLSYGYPSILKFGSHSIISQEGAQQGDPLGPLLFCLALHPMLTSLSSALVIGYLDYITLGGDVQTLAQDVQQIKSHGVDMGLNLNVKQCEIISNSSQPSDAIFQNFIYLDTKHATL